MKATARKKKEAIGEVPYRTIDGWIHCDESWAVAHARSELLVDHRATPVLVIDYSNPEAVVEAMAEALHKEGEERAWWHISLKQARAVLSVCGVPPLQPGAPSAPRAGTTKARKGRKL